MRGAGGILTDNQQRLWERDGGGMLCPDQAVLFSGVCTTHANLLAELRMCNYLR